ncbi:hypothetical protein LXL04_021352 [Taraxacum kok-saghyz]
MKNFGVPRRCGGNAIEREKENAPEGAVFQFRKRRSRLPIRPMEKDFENMGERKPKKRPKNLRSYIISWIGSKDNCSPKL